MINDMDINANKISMEEMTDLDDSWIQQFDIEDNLYKNYYKEDINYIKLNYIYINKENCIDKIKEEIFLLSVKNYLSREDIITIIKKNNIINKIQYKLLYILKYNINIEPNNLQNYLKTKDNLYYNYFTSVKNIDSIYFQPTISLFHDINNLIFVFYEKKFSSSTSHSVTKKIFLQKKINNKSLRNTFKDIK
jgi:hypothetical protein